MIRSLYVHVPFCSSICFYCDFARTGYNEKTADRYLDELERELNAIEQDRFVTAYIGGGTPTALSYAQFSRLLKMVKARNISGEFTVEINPDSFSEEKARAMADCGVNRASIGVQSFDERLLKAIGRKHDNSDVINTLAWLREAGVTNISIDLMYGFSNQTVADVHTDLLKAMELGVSHISIYELEVHDNTVFGKRGYQQADEEERYLMYRDIIDTLSAGGYRQYELSNFSAEGCQSEHNKTYWHYDDYYGAGLSASGKIGNIRYENTSSLKEYLAGNHVGEKTELSQQDVRFEAVMMGLRLLEGIDIDQYDRKYGCSLMEIYQKQIAGNMNKGLLEISDGHLRATEKGLFVLNDILVDFLD